MAPDEKALRADLAKAAVPRRRRRWALAADRHRLAARLHRA